MSKARASLCVIAATVVAAVALFFAPKPAPKALRTAVITRGRLQVSAMVQGTVAYADTRYVPAPVSGRVEAVYAEPGDRLLTGQLIVQFDRSSELAALSALEKRQYAIMNQLAQLSAGTVALEAALGELLPWEAQHSQLQLSMAAKQIRADGEGVLGNLYISPGDYVLQGAPLAEVRSDELCITAFWTGNQSRLPAPGMAACWCDADGTPAGELLLKSVALAGQDAAAGLKLCFAPVGELPLQQPPGTGLPIRLVLDELPETGLAPLSALDPQGCLWLIRDGRAVSCQVAPGEAYDGLMQVPVELEGCRVVLDPESATLTDGALVRTGEDM